MAELVYTRRYYPARLAETVINVVLGFIELLLAVRIVLELLAANASAPFVAWLYSVSYGLVAPFQGAFPSLVLSGGYIIDLSAILAMIAYAVIAWLVVWLISFIFSAVD
jgi:uncharacterized protein YggT (Ycf19 family)